jgi:hypothetical protein
MRLFLALPAFLFLFSPAAFAGHDPATALDEAGACAICPTASQRDPWKGLFDRIEPAIGATRSFEAHLPAAEAEQAAAPQKVAFEYSHGYQVRRKIHKYASFATLPLFATQLAVGQSLYDEGGGTKKSVHAALGAAIGSLFAVNTVTGVWNLVEARKDPVGRTRRWTHGLLMLAADTGFLATFATTPDEDNLSDSRRTHRTVAITSIGIATAGYLTMLIGR